MSEAGIARGPNIDGGLMGNIQCSIDQETKVDGKGGVENLDLSYSTRVDDIRVVWILSWRKVKLYHKIYA